MEQVGRMLILVGSAALILGLFVTFGDRLPFRLGRLPLDFRIERDNFSFYFPLGTSIVISVVVSLILMFLSRR